MRNIACNVIVKEIPLDSSVVKEVYKTFEYVSA